MCEGSSVIIDALPALQTYTVYDASTGGTNWQKYLPPRFQQIIYFPELWSEEEKQNWGKPQ